MSDHGHDGSQHGSGRPDTPSPRSEIGGPAGGTPEDYRRSTAALRRRVLHLSNELRQATRRADEATDLNRERICSLKSHELMCTNQGREIGRYRAEVNRLREERDTLQAFLESDRVMGMDPPSAAPEISALETQIADLNRDLDRRLGEIRHLQAHIDDLTQDRGNLESTIHHLASEMSQAGGEILDLQQANRDLDRSREDAESTLSATEESLRRTRSELDRVEAELLLSRSDRTDRGSSGPDLQPQPADPQPTGPTQADLDQVVRDRDTLRDQTRARDAEILSAQQTLRSTSPSPSRPQKKRSVPVEVDDGSMEEEDASEFDLGGGSTGGRSPSADQTSFPPSKDVDSSQPSGEVIEVRSGSGAEEEEEEENAEVADDLYEAQTLMGISQFRSEARRRDHASPQCRSVGGSGGSPGGSDGSNSDAGSGDQGNGSGPTGGSGLANPPPGRQPLRITFEKSRSFGH
ncbi:Hypothetical protein PHPALM_17907 [Phytophthora palmivora]|uniref:Uncharacterized protein n=1 Tax=Phytophthora palmivora TaxID=4796 RepID=A0A2P4XL23_9STRA|nr:Hypothetical protein PHPALM_17907 [Phytophthora palmivora]